MFNYIFLAAAIGITVVGIYAIIQIKKSLFSSYTEIWPGFWIGLALVLISAGFLITHQLVNLSSQVWLVLPIILAFLGGLFLMIRGIRQYLVFGIMLRQEHSWNLKQIACLKKISSSTEKTNVPSELLKENFNFLLETLGCTRGGVFKLDLNSYQMGLVYAQGAEPDQANQLFQNARSSFSAEALNSFRVLVLENLAELPQFKENLQKMPELAQLVLVPLQHKAHLLGWGLLVGDSSQNFDYKTTQFLAWWGQVVAQKLELLANSSLNQKRENYLKSLEELSELLHTNLKLDSAVPHLAKIVQKIQDFQHFSLAVLDSSGQNMRRFTLGATGNLLLEKGVNLPTQGSDLTQVLETGEILIDTDYSTHPEYPKDYWFKASGCRARLVVPLRSRKRMWGALTLGHLKPGFFQTSDLKSLKLLLSQLTLFLIKTHLLEEIERKGKIVELLQESLELFEEHKDLKEIMEQTAQKVACQLPVSFCKIMLLDSMRQNLRPYALYKLRNGQTKIQQENPLSLSDLPWHRLALESKRPQLIKQDDPESVMSSQEAKLALSEKIESALLIPILMEDQPIGIMSLGELRNWSRRPLKKDEMVVASNLAFQTSQALRGAWLDYKLEQLKAKKALDPEGWAKEILDLKYDINNPLTSIFGASELLQIKEKELSPESLHYVRVIERNARRIQETLEKSWQKQEPELIDWENLTIKP